MSLIGSTLKIFQLFDNDFEDSKHHPTKEFSFHFQGIKMRLDLVYAKFIIIDPANAG
jgi:hypothetical protein